MARQRAEWVVAGGKAGEYGHCTRCGEGLSLGGIPQRFGVAIAAMNAFVKAHTHCQPSGFTEPLSTTPEGWVASRDTGISSGTIYAAVTGKTSPYPAHWDVPHDPADFGRCYRLLKLFPVWLPDLIKTVYLCPKWKPFVENWDELTALYESELANGTAPTLYKRIQELEKSTRATGESA